MPNFLPILNKDGKKTIKNNGKRTFSAISFLRCAPDCTATLGDGNDVFVKIWIRSKAEVVLWNRCFCLQIESKDDESDMRSPWAVKKVTKIWNKRAIGVRSEHFETVVKFTPP